MRWYSRTALLSKASDTFDEVGDAFWPSPSQCLGHWERLACWVSSMMSWQLILESSLSWVFGISHCPACSRNIAQKKEKEIFRQTWKESLPQFLFHCCSEGRRRYIFKPSRQTVAGKERNRRTGDRITGWKPWVFLKVPSFFVFEDKDHWATVLQRRVWK